MNIKTQGLAIKAIVILALWNWQIHAKAETPDGRSNVTACALATDSASDANAFSHFEGVVACSKAGDQANTNLLMILGQIRAMSDMTILTPLDDESARRSAELYSLLFYKFGGLGFDEFYRDPKRVIGLESRIRKTELNFKRGYDPGWAYRPSSKTDIYINIVTSTLERRIWQMRNNALLMQNDEYYQLHLEATELRKANPVFEAGTPAIEKHAKLMARMQQVSKQIPQLPQPKDTTDYSRLNEQGDDLAGRQVAQGFNGPAFGDTLILRSESEVRASWLAKSLSNEEIADLIKKTDFATQALFAYGFGKQVNASGMVLFSELGYRKNIGGYSVSTRIGVVPESCGISFTESYPFVVGVTKAVPRAKIRSSSRSNFPDKCGPIASGKPATLH